MGSRGLCDERNEGIVALPSFLAFFSSLQCFLGRFPFTFPDILKEQGRKIAWKGTMFIPMSSMGGMSDMSGMGNMSMWGGALRGFFYLQKMY